MSRIWRILAMAGLFALFFFGSPILALTIFPTLRLTSRDRDTYRARCTALLGRGIALILWAARFTGVVRAEITPPPVDRSRPYVMISNHPTFVDMILLMGAFRELTCVTKGSWSKHWALGRLLRSTNYLPGPGSGQPESEDMLGSMVTHLSAGYPLLVFPEGQRSMKDQLRRFRRGAVEAAVAANVPIVPVFLALSRPYLTKDVPLWRPPRVAPTYTTEWLGTIDPADFGHDGKRIHEHLVALYDARFEKQLAMHRALAA
ncbi:MAG: lysophospholipid acyltransferase family protein [Sandaracinus sp.]